MLNGSTARNASLTNVRPQYLRYEQRSGDWTPCVLSTFFEPDFCIWNEHIFTSCLNFLWHFSLGTFIFSWKYDCNVVSSFQLGSTFCAQVLNITLFTMLNCLPSHTWKIPGTCLPLNMSPTNQPPCMVHNPFVTQPPHINLFAVYISASEWVCLICLMV